MSTFKFVIHSSTNGGEEDEEFGFRAKRAKHACQSCQSKKVKCSGSQPCSLCTQKKIPCIFKEAKTTHRKRKSSPTEEKVQFQNNQKDIKTSKFKTSSASSTSSSPSIQSHSQLTPQQQRHHQFPHTQPPPQSQIQTQPRSQPHPPSSTTIPQHPQQQQQQQQQSNYEEPSAKRKKVTKTQTTRQPFFRWLGPTAIAPPKSGTFRLLSVNLRSNESVSDPADRRSVLIERPAASAAVSVPQPPSTSTPSNGQKSDSPSSSISDHDTFPSLPGKQVYRYFMNNMSNILPYLSIEEFENRLAQGLLCECLLYAIAAISEKLQNDTPVNSEKYLEAAKRLVLPHLASPSVEIVYTLLLIAYAEFGEDRDSGLWAWSGMAIRMCYDLGLHKNDTSGEDVDSKVSRRVFWAVVSLDRIISCGTGRNATVPDQDIEYEPELCTLENGRSDPFPYLCRLFKLLGRVSNYLNSSPNTEKLHQDVSPSALSPDSLDTMEKFAHFQQEVSDFYTNLPPDLLFDVHNFQEFSKIQQSQVFLLLHVWNQALVLAVHHPTLVYPKCNLDTMGLISSSHAEVTGSGAISIADMVAFADLIESNSFLANPFMSQPIYMAACASMTLWHRLPQNAQPQSLYTLQRTYYTSRQILARMQKIWRGISWHARTLESLAASEPDVDLSVNPKGTINTKDLGVVRKATIDDSTRQWLANEMGNDTSDDIYGLFIAGTTDGFNNNSTMNGNHHFKFLDEAQTGDVSSTTSNTTKADMLPPTVKTSLMDGPWPTPPDAKEEDTFKSFVVRNMDLEEYLGSTGFTS